MGRHSGFRWRHFFDNIHMECYEGKLNEYMLIVYVSVVTHIGTHFNILGTIFKVTH